MAKEVTGGEIEKTAITEGRTLHVTQSILIFLSATSFLLKKTSHFSSKSKHQSVSTLASVNILFYKQFILFSLVLNKTFFKWQNWIYYQKNVGKNMRRHDLFQNWIPEKHTLWKMYFALFFSRISFNNVVQLS